MDNKKLVEQLEKIPLGRMYQASFKALVRLQVYFTGRTHELLLKFQDKAQAAILRGSKDKALDGARGFALQSDLLGIWGDTFTEWSAEFQQVRREAVAIPFGVLAVTHERLIRPIAESEEIATAEERRLAMTESVNSGGVFSPQLRQLVEVAAAWLYGGSSLNLSQRIWKLDRDSRETINQVLMAGITNGDSAWNIAKALESALGAGADCPRWTSTRLYGMSAAEKLTSKTGLLSGDACDGRGVSYNALRLARTEIQKAHALATDKIMAMQPWVEQEQIHLSQMHPEHDECDDVVDGGKNGDGIYPKGEIELPIHPNCLCFKTAVMMDQKAFTSKINGWLKGTSAWPEMDQYAKDLGVDLGGSVLEAATGLAVWLLGNELSEWLK